MSAMERDNADQGKIGAHGGLMRNMLIAVGALVIVIVAVSVKIGLKKEA